MQVWLGSKFDSWIDLKMILNWKFATGAMAEYFTSSGWIDSNVVNELNAMHGSTSNVFCCRHECNLQIFSTAVKYRQGQLVFLSFRFSWDSLVFSIVIALESEPKPKVQACLLHVLRYVGSRYQAVQRNAIGAVLCDYRSQSWCEPSSEYLADCLSPALRSLGCESWNHWYSCSILWPHQVGFSFHLLELSHALGVFIKLHVIWHRSSRLLIFTAAKNRL